MKLFPAVLFALFTIPAVIVVVLNDKKYSAAKNAPVTVFRGLQQAPSEVDRCVGLLEQTASGMITRENYVTFLNALTEGSSFTSFRDLPLRLVMLFYSASCSGERNCAENEPFVQDSFVHFLCSQLVEYFPPRLVIRFQYLLQENEEQRAEELLGEGADLDTISMGLEQATELLLSSSLRCNIIVVDDEEAIRQRRLLNDCPYVIQALVDSITAFDCEPDTNTANCHLVTSRAIVTASEVEDTIDRSDLHALRASIVSTLREAINGDGFESFLSF